MDSIEADNGRSLRDDERSANARNAESVRRLFTEGFNRGDLAVVDALVAPGYEQPQPGLDQGPDGLKRRIALLRSVFPDLTVTVEDMIAAGDKVWTRSSAKGTQRGPLLGLPSTGRRMTIEVIDVFRFTDGRMVEHWGVLDRYDQLAQLGLLPPPGSRARRPAAARSGRRPGTADRRLMGVRPARPAVDDAAARAAGGRGPPGPGGRLRPRTNDVRRHDGADRKRANELTKGSSVDNTTFDAVARRIATTTGRRNFTKSLGALALGAAGIIGVSRAASAEVGAADKRRKCIDRCLDHAPNR
ncbi:MAG TPA: ester cyclase, partial [Thermomicrobiales bacterium]|nr:ester cyclase [Thermomicrobiales bacterium]